MRNVKTVFQISDQPIEEQKSLSKTSELSPKYETESAGDACVKVCCNLLVKIFPHNTF